ncbi:MAG: hypothetical protein FJW31_04165 [Acidobacteria bacterium]|nr:hypothetical protein [Acidobacteriota bacterium]
MVVRILLSAVLSTGFVFAQAPTKEEVRAAMRKAAVFYRHKVSTEGGYHYTYAADLSYGQSEHSEGPTMVETQREATPVVAMAYLDAYEATQEAFYLDAARAAAQALVRGQLCSGGWDYSIEFDPAKRSRYPYRADKACGEGRPLGTTTLDDNVTQACVRVLMRVDRELAFKDAAIHEAAEFALSRLMAVQYPIGAWPQRFERPADYSKFPARQASYPESWPWKWPGADYRSHYTFNDNTIADVIDMFLEAARVYSNGQYLAAAEQGGEFILRAQMPDPQPGWAQQYDAEMRPSWARQFEPPSVTGGETQGILRILMALYRETGHRKYLDPIGRALAWLEKSVLQRTDGVEAFDRIPKPDPVLARFYELKTNKPLYVTKGTMINAAGLGSRRPDGYELSYEPNSVITHYGVLVSGRGLEALRRDFDAISRERKQREARLHGLSPWSDEEGGLRRRPPKPEQVRATINAMDPRGVWTKPGLVGKADRVASVFAARDMVLRIRRGLRGASETIPLNENDTVEIFMGQDRPREQVISSQDFARNLTALAAYAR